MEENNEIDEIELINNINKNSFSYIFNKFLKNNDYINMLINYINLFLTKNNDEYFIKDIKKENNLEIFINYIDFIINNTNLKNEYKILIIKLLLNNNLLTIKNINYNIINYILENDTLLRTFFEYNNNIDIYFNIISNIQDEKNILKYVINLISENECRNKIHKEEDDYKIIKKNEKLLYNILKLLINYWSYLSDNNYNNCSNIKLNLLKENIEFTDKYSTYFVILIKLINITIFYNISQEKELNNTLKLINMNKENIDNNVWVNFIEIKDFYNNLLETKYKNIYEDIHKIKNILSNNFLIKVKQIYSIFINQLDYLIIENENLIINDNLNILKYLENIIDFSIYCLNRKIYNKKTDFQLFLFLFKILNNKNISNYNINQKTIDFILYYSISNLKHIYKEISLTNSKLISYFYDNIINFYSDLDKIDDYSKNDTKYKILYTLRLLTKDKKNIFNNILNSKLNNHKVSIIFIHSIIKDIDFYMEELILYLKSKEYLLLVKTLYSIVVESLNYIKLFIENNDINKNVIYNNELFIKFINLINLHINNISDSDINLCDNNSNYNLSEICNIIMNIFISFNNKNKDLFIKNMSKDTRSFNKNNYTYILNELYNNEKLNYENYNILNNLISKIDSLNKIELKKNLDDIPYELCDPISNELFEEPVILPTSNIIIELSSIKRHLLNNNNDPFNRKELFLEQIIDFNNKDENKQKIKELKSKIKLFLNS